MEFQRFTRLGPYQAYNGKVYFHVQTPGPMNPFPSSLWVTDGTTEGTRQVAQTRTMRRLTKAGSLLFFWGYHGLGRSDGTEAGTYSIYTTEFADAPATDPVFFDGAYYFSGNLKNPGIFKSDGTVAGTTRVIEIQPLAPLQVIRDRLIIYGVRLKNPGRGFFQSEGTEATTFQIEPGRESPSVNVSSPAMVLGDRLLFSASNELGSELWALSFSSDKDEDPCPLDTRKTAPGACGCGTADTDYDVDQVPDCFDPTPAATYPPVATIPTLTPIPTSTPTSGVVTEGGQNGGSTSTPISTKTPISITKYKKPKIKFNRKGHLKVTCAKAKSLKSRVILSKVVKSSLRPIKVTSTKILGTGKYAAHCEYYKTTTKVASSKTASFRVR